MKFQQFQNILKRPKEEGFNYRDGYPHGFPEDISVSTDRYTSEEFFELEKKNVFEKTWLFVAHTDQLKNSGDFLQLDMMEKIGHPIVLVKGSDNQIRAFYNTCVHRGGPLVQEENGNVGKRLVCKYHAWSYTLEGDLNAYPEPKNFPENLKQMCPSLKQVACDTWGNLIFIRLGDANDPNAQTLREYLEPVASVLDTHIGEGGKCQYMTRLMKTDISANWKLPGDGNIECYHVNFVHKDSVSSNYNCGELGEWLFPRGHSSMLIFSNEHAKASLDHVEPGENPAGELAGMGTYNFLVFPNLVTVLVEDMAILVTTYPSSAGKSTYYALFVSAEERTEENAARLDMTAKYAWKVLLEDLAVMDQTQQSMASPSLDNLVFQYQERRCRYVHEEIDRLIGAEQVPESMRAEPLMDHLVEEKPGE